LTFQSNIYRYSCFSVHPYLSVSLLRQPNYVSSGTHPSSARCIRNVSTREQ